MEGYTSHIILAAPLKWWPSLRALHSYPLDSARSFMASCTETEMPLPSQINVLTREKEENVHFDVINKTDTLHDSLHKEEQYEELENNVCNCNRSAGLSRLGRSLFALAEVIQIQNEYNSNVNDVEHENNNKTRWAVKVFDPFSQKLLYFDVCYVPLHMKLTKGHLSKVITTNKTNNDKLEWYDWIRIIPQSVHKQCHASTHSSNNINTLLFARPARVLWSKINHSILRNVQNEEQHEFNEHEKLINDYSNDTCSNEKGNCYATSVFVDGDADVSVGFCQALLAHAKYNLSLLNLSTCNYNTYRLSQFNTEHVCEVRHLNFSVLCRLDEREVLHNIHAAFTPIPVKKYNINTDNTIVVQPIIFIILQGIELLTSSYASENNNVPLMASVICYALCNQIDNITLNSNQHDHNNNNKYVILTLCNTQHGFMSARELNKQLPPSLASRLLRYNFYLPRSPCIEDVSRWLDIKFNKMNKATENKLVKVNKMYQHYSFTEWLSVNVNSLKCIVQEEQSENAASHNNNNCDKNSHKEEEEVNVYAHLFGLDEVIQTVEQLLIWPLQHLSVLQNLQIDLPRGLLLCGSAGTGKTSLMKALADRLTLINNNNNNNYNLYINVMMIDALSLLTKEVGSSEKNIARLFAQARRPFTFQNITINNKPNNEFTNTNINMNNINNYKNVVSVLFIDNLDSLAPPRQRENESGSSTTTTDRTLSTLLMEMDGVASQRFHCCNKKNLNENNGQGDSNDSSREEMSNVPVMIIAAAPSIASLDPAIIRPGRLDIHCNLPSSHSFEFMSKILTDQLVQFVNKMNVIVTNNTTFNQYDNHAAAVIVEEEDKADKGENKNVNYAMLERCILEQLQEQTQEVKELSAAQYMAVLRDVFIELLAKVSASGISLSSTTEQAQDNNVKHTLELNELVQLLEHALSKV